MKTRFYQESASREFELPASGDPYVVRVSKPSLKESGGSLSFLSLLSRGGGVGGGEKRRILFVTVVALLCICGVVVVAAVAMYQESSDGASSDDDAEARVAFRALWNGHRMVDIGMRRAPRAVGKAHAHITAAVDGWTRIEPGSFMMGSEGARSDEAPLHEVQISRRLLFKATEVTQGEWLAVFRTSPSYHDQCGGACPVEQINWWEALAFCNELSRRFGFEACYELLGCTREPGQAQFECEEVRFVGVDCRGYRLPTEAEWEFAARAGSDTPLSCGDTSCASQIAWTFNAGDEHSHAVAQKQANAYGLYDMSGNVSEWVWDWYGRYPAQIDSPDPSGPSSGEFRVLRGGSWYDYAEDCRSARRFRYHPSVRRPDLGFRPVRTLPSRPD